MNPTHPAPGQPSQVSPKQLAANRANAQKSPGPLDPVKKQRTSQNAIKHGFFAKALVLPGENPAAYEALAEQIWSDLRPGNALEELMVNQIIQLEWRLGRLMSVEAAIYNWKRVSPTGHDEGPGFAFVNDSTWLDAFGKLSRYETSLSRRLQKCLHELRELRKHPWSDNAAGELDERAESGACLPPENPEPAAQPAAAPPAPAEEPSGFVSETVFNEQPLASGGDLPEPPGPSEDEGLEPLAEDGMRCDAVAPAPDAPSAPPGETPAGIPAAVGSAAASVNRPSPEPG